MGFPGSTTGAVAALDFFSGRARAILAVRAQDGGWRILGSGEAPLEGLENGRITHLSDAAETVAAALAAAVRAAGRKPETVFYAFHDPEAVFRRFKASRMLAGEGQVRASDVRAVFSVAERLAGSFETANVCHSSLGFVIDDQDPVTDPVGVFGRKIEIEAGFLQARSETLAQWKDLMRRAYCPSSWAVPVAQAVVLGAVGPKAERAKRLIFFERGGEAVVCRAAGKTIESCESASMADYSPNGSAAKVSEIITAGDNAAALAERLGALTGLPSRPAAPEGVAGLSTPQDVPTVGILAVAREREKMRLTARHGQGLARTARRKLTAFWNEYF